MPLAPLLTAHRRSYPRSVETEQQNIHRADAVGLLDADELLARERSGLTIHDRVDLEKDRILVDKDHPAVVEEQLLVQILGIRVRPRRWSVDTDDSNDTFPRNQTTVPAQ